MRFPNKSVELAEEWIAELERGSPDAAWDMVLGRYRRVIFAAIRHYARDYDDVMDVFAHVCEALREDDLRRLRAWSAEPRHRARFSTWLVTVVRNLTVDWFRSRDGRRRLPALVEDLPLLERRIFEHVFLDQKSHVEAYELIRTGEVPDLTFRQFLAALRVTYRAVTEGRRGRISREFAVAPPEESGPLEADLLDAEDLRERLEQAMAALRDEDRTAVQMYVVDEVSAEVVAKVLGFANAKAVYNRVYRALGTLREQLERSGMRAEDL